MVNLSRPAPDPLGEVGERAGASIAPYWIGGHETGHDQGPLLLQPRASYPIESMRGTIAKLSKRRQARRARSAEPQHASRHRQRDGYDDDDLIDHHILPRPAPLSPARSQTILSDKGLKGQIF